MRQSNFNPFRILCPLFLLFLALPCNAASVLSPDEVVRETTREVLNRLEMDKDRLAADPEYIKVVVRELIVPHMDFRTMAGLVLGKDWGVLSDPVKNCFSKGLRNLLVERYSHILLSYHKHNISYQPAVSIGSQGYYSVTQTLTRDDRKPLTIGYPMRRDEEGWSVVDLVIDGVSLVKSYRITYEKEISEQGLAEFIYSFQECKNLSTNPG